ncbi:hypothetical protein LBMAG42_43820 [Deltaproteobacteria bacterium]|nr:hypothetical protein LBMAG42_43820 [Deltaproteobacteria bacterium]
MEPRACTSWIIPLLAACAAEAPAPGEAPAAAPPPAPAPSLLAPGSRPDLLLLLVDGLRDGGGDLHRAAAALESAAFLPDTQLRRYRSAYSATIEPYVALGSLLSARYPSQAPLCGWPPDLRTTKPWCVSLPAESPTIGEVLRLYDYETAFVSVVEPLDPSVVRGFDVTVNPAAGGGEAAWTWASGAAIDWWGRHGDKPRLLVVQVPIDLAATRALAATSYEGAFADAMDTYRAETLPLSDPERYRLVYGERTILSMLGELRSRYAAAATGAAHGFGPLLDAVHLTAPRPTLLAITSLHGQSIGEYAGTPHPEQLQAVGTRLLLERTVHVPLTLVGAGAAADVDAPVELIDLGPTFFALAGATPPAGLVGHDLLASTPDPNPTAYAEFGDMLLLREGPSVVTFRSERHGTSSIDPELTRALAATPADRPNAFVLHNVVEDPLQAKEQGRADPSARAKLRDVLTAVRSGPAAPPTALSVEDEAQLKDLRAKGYW